MRSPHAGAAGHTALEMLISSGVVLGALSLGLPHLLPSDALRFKAAAREVVMEVHRARSVAARTSGEVGLRFELAPSGALVLGLYGDGNRNGVTVADIEAGRDPLLEPPRQIERKGVAVALLAATSPIPLGPQGEGPEDPVRFGREDILTVTALGRTSPGTLYLTSGALQGAVLVSGASVPEVLTFDGGAWYQH